MSRSAASSSSRCPGGSSSGPPGERFTFATRDHRLLVQELVRAALAFSFVVLFAGVIVFGFTKVESDSWDNVQDYLDVLVPALSALLGSATRFYFASRR